MRITYDIIDKRVYIATNKGNVYIGHIVDVCPEYDSDDGKKGIYLITDNEQLYLSENDIKLIEVL